MRVDVVGDLEADRRAEPAAQQFLLQRLQEVLGVVLFHLHVLVAGDAEGVVLQDFHAGEELVQVDGDDFLDGHERTGPSGDAACTSGALGRPRPVDGDQPRQLGRHLDAGEELLVADRVADHDGQVQRQPRDVREGVRRVHRQRRQDGEDLLGEELRRRCCSLVVQLVPVHEVDVLVRQRRPDLLREDLGVALP